MQLASTLVELGRDKDATAQAHAAYRVFHRLGAAHAAGDAAALLRRLAGSVDDAVDLGGPHLTPREVEVVRLLARGLSNQVIAAELFLSVRTVERHIGETLSASSEGQRRDALVDQSPREICQLRG